MPTAIPFVPSLPSYRMQVSLNATAFIMDVQWNDRDGAWYMDIYDSTETPIYTGIKIVLGSFLGLRCADPRFPSGVLIANDLSGSGLDAGIDDLGARVAVWFYLPFEVAALFA